MTPLAGQVSFDRILGADRTPEEWLTYNGTLSAQRHSALTQITPANVKNLELQWVFQARSLEKFEASPLVVGGVLYTVQAPNDVVALDAVTGPCLLGLYAHAVAAGAVVLRAREPRPGDAGPDALHGDHRRPADRPRRQERRGPLERGRRRRARRSRAIRSRSRR